MVRALVGYLFVLPILALWSETAGALVLTVTPPNPNANQSVTLTVSGMAPYLAVGYQVSETGGDPWRSLMDPSNPSSVYVCHHEPCTLVFPSPGRVTALNSVSWPFIRRRDNGSTAPIRPVSSCHGQRDREGARIWPLSSPGILP